MTEKILKNIGAGLIAQVWSGVLGVVVLPILVRGLGAERYGLLALSLAVIGFAAIADLGVGRAASKYLAEDFERNETSRTEQHIATALTICTLMGAIGTVLLLATTPVLVDRILKTPANLHHEARMVLWVTACGLLPVLWRICFDGALAGHHRISELSLGNVIANTLKAGLSVAAVLTGRSIVGVVLANVCVSYLHAAGLWLYARHYFSRRVKIWFGWYPHIARELTKLGLLSSAASFLASVLLLYFDRFVIAAFLPLAALGYYSMAFDITSKQCYLSNPIGQAFYPVFSGKATAGPAEFERHYLHATKMLSVALTGLAAMLIVLARPLLAYWISADTAVHSASVLSLLTVGMLFSSYATLPYIAIIVGSSHPEVCPKIFVLAFAVHAALSLVLVRVAGIHGVALAVVLAFILVFVLSSGWVSKNLLQNRSFFFYFRHCFVVPWMLAGLVSVGFWLVIAPRLHNLWTTLSAFAAGYLLYLAGCAIFAYSARERTYAREFGRKVIGLRAHGGLA